METLLARHKNESWLGPEWDYWNGRIHDSLWVGPKRVGQGNDDIFPSGDRIIWMDDNTATIVDTKSGATLDKFDMPLSGPGGITVLWDGNTLARTGAMGEGYLFDLKQKKVIKRFPKDIQIYGWRGNFSRNDRYALRRFLGAAAEARAIRPASRNLLTIG